MQASGTERPFGRYLPPGRQKYPKQEATVWSGGSKQGQIAHTQLQLILAGTASLPEYVAVKPTVAVPPAAMEPS